MIAHRSGLTGPVEGTTSKPMNAVLSALAKATGQLLDPKVMKVLFKSLLVTLLVFAGLGWALWIAIDAGLQWAMAPILPDDYEGPAAVALTLFLSIVMFWLLFRIVALAVLQFFADEIVIAVEQMHYPEAALQARALPFRRDLANSMRGISRALLFNALALPFAIVLFFTIMGPAIVFLIVNAVLLGREFTDMAWFRHCGEGGEGAGTSPVPGTQRFLLGAAIAAIMTVPFVNFIAPILGAAAGTHLAHNAMGSAVAGNREVASDG